MNIFDATIVDYLSKFSQTSKSFDAFMAFIVDNNCVKGVVLVTMLWFFWFQKSAENVYNRECVIISVLSCLVAITVGRALALWLPFRFRPILNSGIHFIKPFGSQALLLGSMSSFPSDNAVMFFSLASGIFLISRKIGMLTYLYVLVVICFPRVYLGYHFPTDILAGAAIGILITFIISRDKISKPITKQVFVFSAKHTGIFYALTFLLIYEIARMFNEVRVAGVYLLDFLHIHIY